MAHEPAQPGEAAPPLRYSWLYLRSPFRGSLLSQGETGPVAWAVRSAAWADWPCGGAGCRGGCCGVVGIVRGGADGGFAAGAVRGDRPERGRGMGDPLRWLG